MKRTTTYCAVLAVASAMFFSTTSFAYGPWVTAMDLSVVAQNASQPEGVTFTAGDGHVIVDFSEAANTANLETEFVDPLGENLRETERAFYDVSMIPGPLKACLDSCERIADPDDYLECVDYCHENFGGGGGGQ